MKNKTLFALSIIVLLTGCNSTPPVKTSTPPLPGQHLRAAPVLPPNAAPTSVTLAWNPPTNRAATSGFNLYQGTNSGKYSTHVTVTNPAATINLIPGVTNYFAVTTRATVAGLESPPSAEAWFNPLDGTAFPAVVTPPVTNVFQLLVQSATNIGGDWTNYAVVATLTNPPGNLFFRLNLNKK